MCQKLGSLNSGFRELQGLRFRARVVRFMAQA